MFVYNPFQGKTVLDYVGRFVTWAMSFPIGFLENKASKKVKE